MSDFAISDSLGSPVDVSAVQWTSASSLNNYLKSEALHLVVLPDFLQRKDEILTEAAPSPTTFDLSVQHKFQLGASTPVVSLTPGAKVKLIVNATPGSGLLEDDTFHLRAKVPEQTGYVGMSLTGSLDLGVSETSGDLTFGVDRGGSIRFIFLKAFALKPFAAAPHPPTLWNATAAMISGFVIPASVTDLQHLNTDDVCSVTGVGSLKISGSVTVAVPVNPLVSVNLPLDSTTFAVKDGAMAGISAELTISGSYQIRLEKLLSGAVRLSYLSEAGTALKTDFKASAGVSVKHGSTDLLAKLLGAISTVKIDQTVLDGLTHDDAGAFNKAIKDGVDHSLQASLDAQLTASADHQIAFQYEIEPGLLDDASTEALNGALKGDLRLLTAFDEQADGTIAAGIKLIDSVFSATKARGVSLRINLLGIVNLISSSNLVSKCEFLFEPTSGDLTIKETAKSDRIGAVLDPYKRQQALCKALFDSVLLTTAYVAGEAISMPVLSCQTVHFADSRNGGKRTFADYANWFVAMNLISREEKGAILEQAGTGGPSTCTVRATLDNAACEAMFFDAEKELRPRSDYLELGRQALKALLNTAGADGIDALRYRFLDNDQTWQQAVKIGPNPELNSLMPISSSDGRFVEVSSEIGGDVYDIVWWAESMVKAGRALQAMRTFLAGGGSASDASDPAFVSQRNALQKTMLGVVGSSRLRFEEPWGLVCLYWAAGSRQSSGKLTSPGLTLERPSGTVIENGLFHSESA